VLERADLILHVGDLTGAAMLEELQTFAPVAVVHGNMDVPEVRAALPERLVVEAEGLRIGLVHDAGVASGRWERLVAAFPDCDAIAYGHTHVPEVSRVGAVWILNPGSPTERRRAAGHTMIVLERGEPQLVSLDR
jgi:putative phosphoesterase